MPTGVYPRHSEEQRFWAKVDPCRTDGCALWLGAHDRNNYGSFCPTGKTIKAHHFLVGKPPGGFEWDHTCRVRNCVWPDHLELVTHAENVKRGKSGSNMSVKTHCPQGHPYDEANTRVYRGRRNCRACNLSRNRAQAQRVREQQATR